MDTSAQNPNQSVVATPTTQGEGPAVAPVQSSQAIQQQQSQTQGVSVGQPISAQPQQPITVAPRSKEGGPVGPLTSEWVSPSSPEITPSSEVQPFVEVHPETPQLSPAAQQAGIQHAKEATPVKVVDEEPLGLKTPHPVLVALKKAHSNVSDSVRWLVELIGLAKEKKEKGGSLNG